MRVWHECCMCKNVSGGGVSDNDDNDDDSDDDDSDDESGRDLSLEIDDLVKGLIPGKRMDSDLERVGRKLSKTPIRCIASEWASLSVHVFPVVLHAGHSVRLTPFVPS